MGSARLAWLAALLSLLAGCRAIPEPRAGSPPAATVPPPTQAADAYAHPEVDAARGEFTTTASMLDTWNAVGQLLVRLEGVDYEGRAQMLGIYAVRYRGQRLLVVTRALVMRDLAQGMRTKVGAALLDGKPSASAAAVELLRQLQRRLPAELARIEAGGGPSARQPPCAAGVAQEPRNQRPRCKPTTAAAVAGTPRTPRTPAYHPT